MKGGQKIKGLISSKKQKEMIGQYIMGIPDFHINTDTIILL